MGDVLPWLFIQLGSLVGIIACVVMLALCGLMVADMVDGYLQELKKVQEQDKENE